MTFLAAKNKLKATQFESGFYYIQKANVENTWKYKKILKIRYKGMQKCRKMYQIVSYHLNLLGEGV